MMSPSRMTVERLIRHFRARENMESYRKRGEGGESVVGMGPRDPHGPLTEPTAIPTAPATRPHPAQRYGTLMGELIKTLLLISSM